MEALPTRKVEDRFGDATTGCLDSMLHPWKIVGVQDDERPTRHRRPVGREASRESTVAEFALVRSVVGEIPAEGFSVERLRAFDIRHVHLDVVDSTITVGLGHQYISNEEA